MLLLPSPCHLFLLPLSSASVNNCEVRQSWINTVWIGDWWINLGPSFPSAGGGIHIDYVSCGRWPKYSPWNEYVCWKTSSAASAKQMAPQCCSHIHINGVITMHYNQEILSLTLWFKKQLWVLIILRRCVRLAAPVGPVEMADWFLSWGLFSLLTDWHLMSWNGFCITMEGSRGEGWVWKIWRWS